MTDTAASVMVALSRATYDDDEGCIEYLRGLDDDELLATAYGLASVAAGFIDALSTIAGTNAESERDNVLAALTDVAVADPSP